MMVADKKAAKSSPTDSTVDYLTATTSQESLQLRFDKSPGDVLPTAMQLKGQTPLPVDPSPRY